MNAKTVFHPNVNYCFLILLVVYLAAFPVSARQDDNKPKPRDIVPVFETARQGAGGAGLKNPKQPPDKKSKRPPYNRVSSSKNSGQIKPADRPGKRPANPNQPNIAESRARQIGITLWQLNEVRSGANFETLIEAKNGRRRYLLPERVSIETIFEPFDRVRFTVESSRRGYLYIVDQEMYADGTLGGAYLVFPSKRINNGANLVAPGKPVELPDLNGNPFYFELRPKNPDGSALTAEILTVIITDRPIPGLEIGNQPALIPEKTLNGWRTKWAGRAEIFESGETASGKYTKRERDAAGGKSSLTAADPLPQTVFLVEANRHAGSLITVPLWYGKE